MVCVRTTGDLGGRSEDMNMVNTSITIFGTKIDLEPRTYRGFRTLMLEFNNVPAERMYDMDEWDTVVYLLDSYDNGIVVRVECEDGLIVQLAVESRVDMNRPVHCMVKQGRLIAVWDVLSLGSCFPMDDDAMTLGIGDVRIRMNGYWKGEDDNND